MPKRLLLLSDHDADVEFWTRVAGLAQFELVKSADDTFFGDSESVVLCNSCDPETSATTLAQVPDSFDRRQVVTLSDKPINSQPQLFQRPKFNHNILRKYDDAALAMYPGLLNRLIDRSPPEFLSFFPADVSHRSGTIKHSGQKESALKRVQEFFEDHQLNARIVADGINAVDELIMNAIFDAPHDEGGAAYRRKLSRDASFPLKPKEYVTLSVACSKDLFGVRVVDQFGALHANIILAHLGQNFHGEDYVPKTDDPGAGLGIHRMSHRSMSLLFSSQRDVRTEVCVFFKNTRSYRDFRRGFCFFSILAD